jgi:hypothetical protein
MSNNIGVSTTYGTILPNNAWLARINNVKLSVNACTLATIVYV